MTYEEAVEVLQMMSSLYPGKVEMTKKKAEFLIPQLKPMCYGSVMGKLALHVSKSPYPPTIADIAVYPPVDENPHLDMLKQWDREAAEVSEEKKRLFQEKLNELIEKVTR
ncbi:hypothetical protein [Halobacillus campisalis]|uniref:Replicative helicase inhibitor G39P N-terminal domain-containing protein n=1 Tax=Halobacillus campisalis TaxID=435909 RepID=A0ABW2K0X4_9BACI|nr:hypothetical protein [Halobacillus campisalis]